ncbi:pentapeptide repeat-containing protein [Streptomyces sp. NPDC007896]|uniref:pentapeptide repeat-containing protein n=1 Tax=Streptomyces sp. NPDC007896 TaxID=3364784 RepID=UPI0036E3E34A
MQAGSDIEHPGTTFSGDLLDELIDALRENGTPRVRHVSFTEAVFADNSFFPVSFSGDVSFLRARFLGEVTFTESVFEGRTSFSLATFAKGAWFDSVQFLQAVTFDCAKFAGVARFEISTFFDWVTFEEVTFQGNVSFDAAVFKALSVFGSVAASGVADFSRCTFAGETTFQDASFNVVRYEACIFVADVDFRDVYISDYGEFSGALFQATHSLGPIMCPGSLGLGGVTFTVPVIIEASAAHISCKRTRWEAVATLRLRHTKVDLSNAVLVQPLSISAAPAPFGSGPQWDEVNTPWRNNGVSIENLLGVDCAMLTLADVDLTPCRFAGALHLDQLRLEGRWSFGLPPRNRVSGFPFRWTQRQVIAEESLWRARWSSPGRLRIGWHGTHEPAHNVPGLATLTIIYRQLRKAREDAKDEPGAADFYYGEMEMRRHSFGWRKAERWLLQAYWLLSGYSLRASRALAWLTLSMFTTILLMMGFGLPQDSPKQQATGTVPVGGGKVIFEIDQDDPKNPTGDRFTTKRFEKALNVTLNSVVFRSSGQDLTTAGTYIEMASRFSEPVLLGLAALAIRGRVKR